MKNISVFYDGYYLRLVIGYYHRTRKQYLDLTALHGFIGRKLEGRVTGAHIYQGRSLPEYVEEHKLRQERYFDLALAKAGVQSHILPLSSKGTEKGVDVWLALEVFEHALSKRSDVVVLIAGDSDYVPLLRKLKHTDARSVVLGWTIPDSDGFRGIGTSISMLHEADQSIAMEAVLNDRREAEDLFVRSAVFMGNTGVVTRVSAGYGFISPRKGGPELFFHHSDLKNRRFDEVCVGDPVEFEIGANQRGECAKEVRVV
jgi:cold shock CspA family protein/uncharacterized LabA/DUF88 family protein